MEQEPESLQQSLRNILTSSSQINTVEQFYALDIDETDFRISGLQNKLRSSDVAKQHEGAVSRIVYLYKQSRFEPLRPLIIFILDNEAKSDEEIIQFIEQHFNGPQSSLPASITSKFRTGTTSSLVNSSFIPALERELDGLMYTNVPGLVEHFINKSHIDPEILLQSHGKFIKQKRQESLSDKRESIILEWIASIFEKLNQQSHSRAWRGSPTTPLAGIPAKRSLDGAIISRPAKFGNRIEDILVPFEFKKNASEARQAALDLAKYVYEVFTAQPTRSYVVGVTLRGTVMQLWLQVNEENFTKFFCLLSSLLTCNYQDLGFDPTFVDTHGQTCTNRSESRKIQIETKDGRQEFVIDDVPIFRASAICGRGTTTWKAHLADDKSRQYLIKDSWHPEKSEQEGDMLCKVGRNLPHVVRYHHHQDVTRAGKRVDIASHVRSGLKFEGCTTLRAKTGPEEPKNVFTNRFHRRLILKDVGQPIRKVKTPARLLEALEGCIRGHHALFNAGYLHRDISINNLMINDQATDPCRRSFLIDLDVAINRESNDDKHHTLTGTKVFMSASLLLEENCHSHVDDLESFFRVFVWICIHCSDEKTERTDVLDWHRQSMEDLGSIKEKQLRRPDLLTKHFADRYKESPLLIDCVAKFAKIMCDPSIRDGGPEAALYLKIVNVLREAQGKPTLSQL
ncbi:hypothetical protein MJO29_009933 [Puccinia striiformis f. sp. tritici]|nr:hypothetical protein MJO29_009933 [Puccinia striiformis f. sp. tritici]